ncbi:MAG TPA: acyltransferase [Pyrinomonadaceae bacterium]|jgi:peptidoglycan/LPS O-acetylase OafA/YrhL|nr:acyltransferase [Pyrinomonadaceae bacterium]
MGASSDRAGGRDRIIVLDFLRGVAALAVVFHHFFNVLDPGWLYTASRYGQLGVQVFFVISGFIIPYSLYRSGYALRNYGTFVLKRVIRLDPPYVVTVALIVLLGVVSWYFPFERDQVFQVSAPQVLLHFAYANVFFGYPWLNDVFWTLAIEFQYYLLIGLAFPLVFSRDARVRLASCAALGALAFVIKPPTFIFYYIFLFLMGILTCQFKVGLVGRRQYALLLAAATAMALLTTDFAQTAAGLAAVCAILFLEMRYAVFNFLGKISYSLYLIHSPVGRRALNVFLRLLGAQSFGSKMVAIALAIAVSVAAAYALYRLVELPAQRWSSALRYRRREKPYEPRPEELEQLNPAL